MQTGYSCNKHVWHDIIIYLICLRIVLIQNQNTVILVYLFLTCQCMSDRFVTGISCTPYVKSNRIHSRAVPSCGFVAQIVDQLTCYPKVVGSNSTVDTEFSLAVRIYSVSIIRFRYVLFGCFSYLYLIFWSESVIVSSIRVVFQRARRLHRDKELKPLATRVYLFMVKNLAF